MCVRESVGVCVHSTAVELTYSCTAIKTEQEEGEEGAPLDPAEALKKEKMRTKALTVRVERLEAEALDAAGVAGKCGRHLLGACVVRES